MTDEKMIECPRCGFYVPEGLAHTCPSLRGENLKEMNEKIAKELESIRFRIDENYELTKERAKMNYERLNGSLELILEHLNKEAERKRNKLERSIEARNVRVSVKMRKALLRDLKRRKRAHLHKKKGL